MISDEQVRRIALFFFLSLMDEKAALQASDKAVAQLKSKNESALDDQALIRVLWQNFEQSAKQMDRRPARGAPETSWASSSPVSFRPWIKFHQEAGKNELVAVLLSRVLGFKEESIASGLGVSLGTARHRISKGMRLLSAHVKRERA